MFCPHCGHQNESQAAQCAGCQRPFAATPVGDTPPAAVTAPSVKCVKCGYDNAWDATQCHACLASLERKPDPTLAAPAPPTPAKWLGAAVGVVAALIVVAQVIHLLAPAPSQPSATVPPAQAASAVKTPPQPPTQAPAAAEDDPAPELQFRLGMSYLRQRKPTQARETFQELLLKYPGSRFATDARAQLEQLGGGSSSVAEAPPSSPAGQPFGAGEDLAAELQYRVATNWMSRHEAAKARVAFEEVIRKYPGSSYAREARAKLAQLPVAAPQAPVQIAKAAPASKIGPPKNTISNEDFRRLGSKSAPAGSTAHQQTGPPPTPKPEGERTLPTLGDKLTLVSGDMAGDKLILTLRYQLALGRTRKVYAAARVVFPEPNSPVFAYSAETFQGSSGMVVVQVPVTSQTTLVRPVSVRLMMFEANGAMFYSQDMPWP